MPADIQHMLAGMMAWLGKPTTPWQLAVIAAALAGGWAAQRLLGPRLALPQIGQSVQARFARRLVFPVTALAIALAGRAIVAQWQPVHVLNIAVALLWAMVAIRAVARLMRYVFPPSAWVSGFERFVATTVWIAFALHVTGFLPDIVRALQDIDFHFGKQRISLWQIGTAVAGIGGALLVALVAGRFLENRLMGAEALDITLRVMFAKLARALVILLAVLIALPAVGVDLTALSVFGGALGVGLGIGLQKIAANYLSGFLILLDRSVKIGDIVTVDNRTGEVTKMTARYLVVKAADGTEALIPNETIIASTVVNLTYSSRLVRSTLAVQVAYGTDLEAALALLRELAADQPGVLAEPAANAVIKGFADSGINLELMYWTDPSQRMELDTRLYLAADRAFRARGIEIPFPQREVRFVGTPPTTP